jgi:hypothetical protein
MRWFVRRVDVAGPVTVREQYAREQALRAHEAAVESFLGLPARGPRSRRSDQSPTSLSAYRTTASTRGLRAS